jgi:type II restriction/modification system DNA methylase subunit YeeA
MVFVFIGAGLYFLILLLKNSHIERNPGPLSESDKQWFSSVLAERLTSGRVDVIFGCHAL